MLLIVCFIFSRITNQQLRLKIRLSMHIYLTSVLSQWHTSWVHLEFHESLPNYVHVYISFRGLLRPISGCKVASSTRWRVWVEQQSSNDYDPGMCTFNVTSVAPEDLVRAVSRLIESRWVVEGQIIRLEVSASRSSWSSTPLAGAIAMHFRGSLLN